MTALFAAGCGTTSKSKTGSARVASIIVENHSTEQIAAALTKAFERRGFHVRHRDDLLMFERPGSVADALLHGDLYGGGVTERVQIYEQVLEEGRILVDCDVLMVQEPDDPFFQTVRQIHSAKHSQEILDAAKWDLLNEPKVTPEQ
ncbi:MAG TPA: hypothetical protein VLT36_19425 [Candidatus Dormibacteraeota bacterium]|nr:hypothetical protein [Candidatus Dormibacteraeota bacterium]